MAEEMDTGYLMEVPEEQRLDTDAGEGSNALEGGDDTEGLALIYENPGEAWGGVLEDELVVLQSVGFNWGLYQGAQRCTGKLTLGAQSLLAWLLEEYRPPGWSGGIYNCRTVVGGSATSLHAEARAVDFMLPTVSGRTTAETRRIGSEIVRRLGEHGNRLGVQCIIWNRTIWSRTSPNGRYYGGTHPHYDHLHIEINWGAANNLTLTTLRSVLGSATCDNRVFRNGDSGECVSEIQRELRKHSISVSVDGSFGNQTEVAVRTFQSFYGLPVDGVVGQQTWISLRRPGKYVIEQPKEEPVSCNCDPAVHRAGFGWAEDKESLDKVKEACNSVGVHCDLDGPTWQFHANLDKTKTIEAVIDADPKLHRRHAVRTIQSSFKRMGAAKGVWDGVWHFTGNISDLIDAALEELHTKYQELADKHADLIMRYGKLKEDIYNLIKG